MNTQNQTPAANFFVRIFFTMVNLTVLNAFLIKRLFNWKWSRTRAHAVVSWGIK